MHLFFVPDLALEVIDLPGEEAGHALRVLRLKRGDRIGLLDGRGTRVEAEILTADMRACGAQVLSRISVPRERSSRVHLAVAPTKQMERFEWMLEKCTEIGVDRITPLITERTERTRLRRDRLERVLIGAMKQSQRAWLPQLDEPIAVEDLMSGELPAQRFFGWCEGDRSSFASAYRSNEEAILLIGPEGDFTPEEAQQFLGQGFTPVSLGEARLRTETAAVTACAYMNMAQQV